MGLETVDLSKVLGAQRNIGRTLILSGEVCEQSAISITESLLQLQKEDMMGEVTFMIDSFGGDAYAMNMVLDMMDMISCPIRTICIGKAMSAGAIIFINGKTRFMSKRSHLMLHQVSYGIQDEVKNHEIEYAHTIKLQDEMLKTVAKKSNLSYNEVKDLIDRNCYLTPEEAIEYGFCDGIITRLK